MENQLFRQKSLERISSPEALHDYLRVTNPRLWMLLSAIAALLAGFLVYASVATLENTMPIRVELQSFETLEEYREKGGTPYITYAVCRVPLAQKDMVEIGMTVRLGKEKGKVSWITMSDSDDTIIVSIEMEHDYIPLPDGEYDAELVLESVTPISFLWN